MNGTKNGRSSRLDASFEQNIAPDAVGHGLFSRRSAFYETRYPPLGVFEQIEDDGVRMRLHLIDTGPGDAQDAIVFIHGASGNVRDFSFSFLDRLAAHPAGAGRRLIAIDRPGFGYSDRGPSNRALNAPHRPDVQARRMRKAIEQRGVRRVVVLGHSLGCATALAWVLDAPQSVSGVVALAGVSHPWEGTAGFSYDLVKQPVIGRAVAHLAARLLSEERAAADISEIFSPQSAPPGYADYVGIGLALRPATIRANGRDVGFLKPLLRAQAERYGEVFAPVEIVHGAEDTIVPPDVHAEPLVQNCASANLTMLAGVGHMPHHCAADAVISAISRVHARSRR